MPTKPIEEFIPRDLKNVQLAKALNGFSNLIAETVNFASNVFKWCIESIKGGDENVPIFLTYRHIFDLLDSISILIKESCAEPCEILLRSVFEALLTVEYILEKNTEQRGKDFLIWNRHHLLKKYRRHNPKDQMYIEFVKKLKEDSIFNDRIWPEIPDIENQIMILEKLFDLPGYKESVNEYKRFKKHKGKFPPYWFNIHNGPENIEKLALYLRRPAQHEMLYRYWSDVTHGTDIIRGKISISEPGVVGFSQLRLPTDAQFVTFMAVSFALSTIRLFVNHFIKSKLKEMGEWYKREIQKEYLEISKGNIIIVE